LNPLFQAWVLSSDSLLLVYAIDGVIYMILMRLFFATCIFWLLVSGEIAKLFQDPKGSQSADKGMAAYELQLLTITTIIHCWLFILNLLRDLCAQQVMFCSHFWRV